MVGAVRVGTSWPRMRLGVPQEPLHFLGERQIASDWQMLAAQPALHEGLASPHRCQCVVPRFRASTGRAALPMKGFWHPKVGTARVLAEICLDVADRRGKPVACGRNLGHEKMPLDRLVRGILGNQRGRINTLSDSLGSEPGVSSFAGAIRPCVFAAPASARSAGRSGVHRAGCA